MRSNKLPPTTSDSFSSPNNSTHFIIKSSVKILRMVENLGLVRSISFALLTTSAACSDNICMGNLCILRPKHILVALYNHSINSKFFIIYLVLLEIYLSKIASTSPNLVSVPYMRVLLMALTAHFQKIGPLLSLQLPSALISPHSDKRFPAFI